MSIVYDTKTNRELRQIIERATNELARRADLAYDEGCKALTQSPLFPPQPLPEKPKARPKKTVKPDAQKQCEADREPTQYHWIEPTGIVEWIPTDIDMADRTNKAPLLKRS